MTVGRRAEALARSLEERATCEGELDQLRNVAQVVIAEVFGPGPSTNAPAIQLTEISDEVRALISEGVLYEASGVLTSMATHHPTLDFTAICGGYTDGWSADEIQALGESLVLHA